MSQQSHPITLGIDPGYDRVGWAVGTKSSAGVFQLISCGCIQTSAKDDIFVRFQQIDQELSVIIATHQPAQSAIESLFFEHNQKTAMRVSEARGLIISRLLQSGMSVAEYTPLQVKQAVTGYGAADKEAVRKMVLLQVPSLQKIQKPLDDLIDAVGICMTLALSRA